MGTNKYNAYKKEFGSFSEPEYKGRIMMNNVSIRMLSNTKMSYILERLEEIVQSWIDAVGMIRKQVNYRIDLDDNDTIKG